MTDRDPTSTDAGAPRSAGDTPEQVSQSVETPPNGPGVDPTNSESAAKPRRGPGRSPRPGAKPAPTTIRPVRVPIAVVRRSVEDTAALRESLAEKEAEAHDLRVSIEQLRQELSAERAQLTATRRRRFPWLWVVAGLLALILLLWLLSRCSTSGTVAIAPTGSVTGTAGSTVGPSTQTSGPATTAPATTAATTGAATTGPATTGPATTGPPSSPSAASVPATPAVTTTPMPWAGATLLTPAGLPTSGPGVDAPGADVTYALDADGTSVDVYERLRSASPMTAVTATLPALTALRSDLGAHLGVQGLQVELDGKAVRPVKTSDTSWTATPATGGATSAVLRYRLTGAVFRVEPALAGRLTALLTPLTAALPLGADQPVVVRVSGGTPRSLTCPTATGASVICGTVTGRTASATLPKGSQPIVQLQFDRT